jgi:transcription elongation factor Elf1
MECSRCANPVDSGVAFHRTHPVTGIRDACHYKCAKCDICGKSRGMYGAGPIYYFGGFLVHLNCFRCAACNTLIITNCGAEWELPDRGSGSAWILGKDQKVYHDKCHPCDQCGIYEIPKTHEKPRLYWDGSDTVARHASCRKCGDCGKLMDAEYMSSQLYVYHPDCSYCWKCGDGFETVCKNGPQLNRYVDSSGKLFHFQCAECGICGKQLPHVKMQDRTLYLHDGKLCHSDCIPCMECHESASGIHVNLVHTKDTDARKRRYMYRHPVGKCMKRRKVSE